MEAGAWPAGRAVRPGEVRVDAATIHVIADDAAGAVDFLRTAEQALVDALEGLGDELGDEVLVIHELTLREHVRLSGARASLGELRRALHEHLAAMLAKVRGQAVAGVAASGVAWYPSEAAAVGDYLGALVRGGAAGWPHRALAGYGGSAGEVLSACVARGGPLLVADVLAQVSRLGVARAIAAAIEPAAATALAAPWTAPAPAAPTGWQEFPRALRAAVQAALRADLPVADGDGSGEPQAPVPPGRATLILLAHLFAAWPPSRALVFEPAELASITAAAVRERAGGEIATEPAGAETRERAGARAAERDAPRERAHADGPTEPAGASTGERAHTPPLPPGVRGLPEPIPGLRAASRAGGLTFWAVVLAESGCEASLIESYPEERRRRAVRWALGRALETSSLDSRDPLLLVWSGEAPRAAVFPAQTLAGGDPEPLHRLAVRLARRRGYLDMPLRTAPFGGGQVVLGGRGVVVDWLPAPDVHDAVADVARRFAERAGEPPAGIDVGADLSIPDLDAVSEIDAPAVADPWRPALWAAASLVRAAAMERWGLAMRDVRGWSATVCGDGSIELPRRHVTSVAAGIWAPPSVVLGEREWQLFLI